MIRLEENELYQELAIYHGNIKIGEAEVEIKGKMLSRLVIYEPYQGKGYGTEVVKALSDKCGYSLDKPTMYLMRRPTNDRKEK